MATSLFFNGKSVSVPGSYSIVDASGLEQVGLGASGIVAVLGTAEGGLPVSAAASGAELQSFSRPDKMRATFRSGDLREVAGMLFEPSKDPDIQGGAQTVVACKVNPATQSTAALQASAVDQILLESRDYGAFTSQINVELAAGTTYGKSISIRYEDTLETGDDIGGTSLATLMYTPGATGYQTMLADVGATGNITATGTRSGLGQSNLVDNPATNAAVEILSSSAGDVGQVVTLFGLVGNVATRANATLNGTSVVQVAGTTWDAGGLLGVYIAGTATAGTVTVRMTGAGVAVFTVPPGTAVEGVIKCDYCYVDRTSVAMVLSAAGTPNVLLFGRNASGGALAERVAMTGTTPVTSATTTFAHIDFIVVGAVVNTTTVTLTARAARSLGAVQDTLIKAADLFNSRSEVIAGPLTRGFTFDLLTGRVNYLTADLDVQTAVSVVDPATLAVTANLSLLVEWINNNSALIAAERAPGGTVVPDNTPSPLFLVGGEEGTALFSHYQTALNLLKQIRVNSIVDLSGDPAVAAAVDAHCAYMGGIGRSERDGFVGALNAGMTDVPTKAELLAAAVDLNSRHIRVFGQAVERYNSLGERTEFLPPFGAAVLAGMQAGSPVGTSLTFKLMNVLGLRSHTGWTPTDDAEDLIQGGVVIAEVVPGLGRRVVRNITTHLASDNLAFIEGSVNEAVNFAVFNFRTNLEVSVGKRGFAGTLSATRTVAISTLGLLTDENIVTGWRALDLELIADVLDVSVELAPVIPVNFVRSTVHLVTLAQLASRAV